MFNIKKIFTKLSDLIKNNPSEDKMDIIQERYKIIINVIEIYIYENMNKEINELITIIKDYLNQSINMDILSNIKSKIISKIESEFESDIILKIKSEISKKIKSIKDLEIDEHIKEIKNMNKILIIESTIRLIIESKIELDKEYIHKLNSLYYTLFKKNNLSQKIELHNKMINQFNVNIGITFMENNTDKSKIKESHSILNFSNSIYIGGKYVKGIIDTKEELLCNTIYGLYDSLLNSNPKAIRVIDGRYKYENINWWDKYIYFSNDVFLYRDSNTYTLYDTPIAVNVITVGVPNLESNKGNGIEKIYNYDNNNIQEFIKIINKNINDDDIINKLINTNIMQKYKNIIYTACNTNINNYDTLILSTFGLETFCSEDFIANTNDNDAKSKVIITVTRTIAYIIFDVILNYNITYENIYFDISSQDLIEIFKTEYEKIKDQLKNFMNINI